jgi:hypothetical protein
LNDVLIWVDYFHSSPSYFVHLYTADQCSHKLFQSQIVFKTTFLLPHHSMQNEK